MPTIAAGRFTSLLLDPPVIVNLYGNSLEEYGELAARIDGINEVAGVEVNISCPNVKQGGIVFGTDPDAARQVVELVRRSTTKPLIVKLLPHVTDVVLMAKACVDAGAEALPLINTLTGMPSTHFALRSPHRLVHQRADI